MAQPDISTKEIKDSLPPVAFEFVQDSFSGGMNLMVDDTKIGANEYREAFNVLNRFDRLDPINTPQEIGLEMDGKKQGMYPVGSYVIAFSNGNAYFRKVTDLRFNQVAGFKMSTTVDRIYICAIPVSSANLQRNILQKQDFAGNNVNQNLDTIFVNQNITASPQCLLCQDGVNQPFIIYFDPTVNTLVARVTQKYSEWKLESADGLREYVPIGTDMLFFDGKLYIFSPDRTRLYPSVTGRPLDFVINITAVGDKGGDADTTFYSIGYAKMIAMFVVSGYTGFCVSTENNNTFGIIPNWDRTLFGEPTFDKETLFNTSALNSFSVVDVLGDTAFIDSEGVKSFNGAKQLKTESGNTIFSLKIATLFDNIAQDFTNTAAIVYNGYALFGVNTIYGNVILVYDTYSQVWVSILRANNIQGKIKQFISLKPYANILYCITDDDKMFEIFPRDTDKLLSEVYTQAFITNNLKIEQRCDDVRCVLRNQLIDGNITVNLSVDDVAVTSNTKPIRTQDKLHNLVFPYTTSFIGWKAQYHIAWDGGGTLTHIMHSSTLQFTQQSFNQMKQIY